MNERRGAMICDTCINQESLLCERCGYRIVMGQDTGSGDCYVEAKNERVIPLVKKMRRRLMLGQPIEIGDVYDYNLLIR